MSVVDRSFDHPLPPEEHAAQPLAGGMMQGYQCGQIWGAALAAGARAYQIFGPGSQAEAAAVVTSQRLVEAFHDRYKEINCLELTEGIWKNAKAGQVLKFLIKGGPARCFSMSAGYAQIAYRETYTNLPGKPAEAIPGPVSCSALLAQKMGLSDKQQTLVAGFAGGIGLCGGACGALGAALWISRIKHAESGPSTASDTIINHFLESSDYEFECSKIVGRKFEDVSDHARYIRDGGCAKIIEALTAVNE